MLMMLFRALAVAPFYASKEPSHTTGLLQQTQTGQAPASSSGRCILGAQKHLLTWSAPCSHPASTSPSGLRNVWLDKSFH